ncbi:PEP-CTERM sorting domain-containing protein [Luteolibacter pohnpeiensis]|uniref:PEP-CTERM sorting domain-containing protein n=1 Tax=Luteolibacter pohnpeiensis TaxID=454153 RepID=A0A934VU65_9BACT|nr:PEP-CTERM sorting domain-containing protein [Luteolibacter pohnpeiensis]MBK1880790.1 PEP-CTERM sorting domain-containing protein [Luteolibacter pohnpeiensis]
MNRVLLSLALPLLSISASDAALIYVDAVGDVGGNTVNAATESTTDWYTPGTGANNELWDLRTNTGAAGVAYGATAYQLNSTETSILLRTAVTGLLPNSTYTGVRLYYIGNAGTGGGNDWALKVSVIGDSTGFISYPDNSGNALVDSTTDALGTLETGTAATDTRYWVSLPDVTTDSSGTFYIWVNIDDAANNRGVYDGLAYDNVAIPEPASMLLLGLAGFSLGFSRRR